MQTAIKEAVLPLLKKTGATHPVYGTVQRPYLDMGDESVFWRDGAIGVIPPAKIIHTNQGLVLHFMTTRAEVALVKNELIKVLRNAKFAPTTDHAITEHMSELGDTVTIKMHITHS